MPGLSRRGHPSLRCLRFEGVTALVQPRPQGQLRSMQHRFTIETSGPGLYEFTEDVNGWVRGDGLLTLFVQHTSCSLLVQENADPAVQRDLLTWIDRAVPQADAPGMEWITHRQEGPDDMPAHVKAALLPVSLQIPVQDGRLALGTWQGLYVFEHRAAPHRRHVAAHLTRD